MSSESSGDNAPTPYTGPDHGFGGDNALANEIVSFDRLADTNGSAAESKQVPSRSEYKPTLEALSPTMRQPIVAQLAGLTGPAREKREGELVLAAMQQRALEVRIHQGPGIGSNAYQDEMFAQARQLQELDREHQRIVAQLGEFDGFKTGAVDPTTGEAHAEKIYRYQGDRRRALENRLVQIATSAEHLEGAEGTRRMQKALARAVEDTKKSRDQYAILQEAKDRATHNAREAKINQLAEGFAKGLRGNGG
jgi:hypothetical protein